MNEHPQRLWHRFADMARMPGHELVLVHGDGAWLDDDHGRRYLDATGSLWYCNALERVAAMTGPGVAA
jgi:putrescine---pyruvate transaminase